MHLIDSLRRDAETLKSLAPKARVQFIWDYYKIPIVAAVCVLALAVLTAAFRLSSADTIMYAVFINADDSGDREALDQLLARSGTDMAGKTIDTAASYTLYYDDPSNTYSDTIQLLAALFGIGDLDLFAADEAVFRSYAGKEAFLDLSLFIERDVLDRHRLYTYTNAEGRQVVAGILLSQGSPLHTAGFYTGDVFLGVAANAQNLDPAVAFVKQVAEEYRGTNGSRNEGGDG